MKFSFAIILFMVSQIAVSQGLENYRWKNRIVLIFTSNINSEKVNDQANELFYDSEGFEDRDLRLFFINEKEAYNQSKQIERAMNSENLRSRFDISPSTKFTFVLIGKDGTEKLKTNDLVTRKRLYSIIDSMPMRQREMRENGSDSN